MERITTPEVARLLAVSTAEVRRLVKLGRLHVERPSPRVLLFDRAEVEQYRQERPGRGWQPGRLRHSAEGETV